ncbi:YD repeat-containing protein [Sphingomonas sp. YR710]|uniref:hypothetical protein n=1 Tax=Sphingomonas sp. YR710 TaxID=1882773 RepID=UPI00088E7B76|nr:hypothetical protein [Sphingomonas sp. YR710]SDD72978.1 YD repeat-containing protein [Sphingomonas sp. YR710]
MILKRAAFLYGLRLAAAIIPSGGAYATETVTYSYDALGRLTQSSTSGTVNNGLVATTTYDAADNRATHVVTGSANSGPPMRVVVLPIAGFTIIPLASQVQ